MGRPGRILLTSFRHPNGTIVLHFTNYGPSFFADSGPKNQHIGNFYTTMSRRVHSTRRPNAWVLFNNNVSGRQRIMRLHSVYRILSIRRSLLRTIVQLRVRRHNNHINGNALRLPRDHRIA